MPSNCANPLGLKQTKKGHQSDVKGITSAYLQKCRQYLTNVQWQEDMKLCTRCRCEVSARIKSIIERQEAGRFIVGALSAAIPSPPAPQPHGDASERSTDAQESEDLGRTSDQGDQHGSERISSESGSAIIQTINAPGASSSARSRDSATGNEESSENEGATHDDNNIPAPSNSLIPSSVVSSNVVPSTSGSVFPESTTVSSGVEYTDRQVAAEKYRRSAQLLGISPLAAGISRRPAELRSKFQRDSGKYKMALERAVGTTIKEKQTECDCNYCRLMIRSILNRFPELEIKTEKYSMLTCLPISVKISDMQVQLGISKYMATKVSKLRNTEGPFSVPEFEASSHPITDEVLGKVREYYLSDDNSRPSPSERQTVNVRDPDGVKRLHALRFMLINAKDAFEEFKKENDNAKIGATKFIQLRPGQCRWPGNKGFPVTCACIIHENFKLMTAGLKNACLDNVGKVSDDDDDVDEHEDGEEEDEHEGEEGENDQEAAAVYAVLDNINELINFVLCTNPTESCYVGVCQNCPNQDSFDLLFKFISDDDIEFEFWETKPNTNLSQLRMPIDEFKDKFLSVLQNFWIHDFIYRQQKQFISEMKTALPANPTHAIVNVDFGENYSFVVKTAVQGFHWSNHQATIHPFVVYFKNPKDNTIKYKTYFVISNELSHDATTFHVFRSKALELMKRDLPQITHVEYFSDGAGSQYKNYKNIANLVHHRQDYGLTANWHFTATSHGKSMCDAMSAVVKRTCRLKSIKDGIRILTAEEMFNVVRRDLTTETLEILFVSNADVELQKATLQQRYDAAKKIPGIRKLHCFKIRDDGMIMAQIYSNSQYHELFASVLDERVDEPEDRMQLNIGEFCAAFICKTYQIGKVVAVNDVAEECTMTMMKKSGKEGVSLSWPSVERERIVSYNDILGKVIASEISKGPGGTYRLSQLDQAMANQNKDARINMLLLN